MQGVYGNRDLLNRRQSMLLVVLGFAFCAIVFMSYRNNVERASNISIFRPDAGAAASMDSQLENTRNVIYSNNVAWTSVSHDPRIKKQVLFEKGIIPKLTGFSRAIFKPGQVAPAHSHQDMHEVFFVRRGHGQFEINNVKHQVAENTTIYLAPGDTHEVTNNSNQDMELIYFGINI